MGPRRNIDGDRFGPNVSCTKFLVARRTARPMVARMKLRSMIGTLTSLVVATTGSSALAAPDYGAKGPEVTATSNMPPGATGATSVKLVVPNGAGPYPVIIASHGFAASADNQLGWAEHFASYGFVVAAPSFPNPGPFPAPDHAKNGTTIEALVAAVKLAAPKADTSRVGFEGHSAGGLASTLAASKAKPQALVLFDPVDANDLGKAAFPTVCSPTLVLYAEKLGQCNKDGAWKKDVAIRSAAPLWTADVIGASHCDGENGARPLCGTALTCGAGAAADPSRQKVHARHATAFFLAQLKGDTVAAATLTQTELAADATISNPTVKSGTPCPPVIPSTPDGGGPVPTSDGGVVAPSPSPGGTGTTPTPTPTGSASANPTSDDPGSSGCSSSGTSGLPQSSGVVLGLGLVVAGLALRRRRSA